MKHAGQILKDLRGLTAALQDQTEREKLELHADALIHAETVRPREALEETTIKLGYQVDALTADCDGLRAQVAKLTDFNVGLIWRLEVARRLLSEIHTTAHCISKAGPASTPTLDKAWERFDRLAVMATEGLSKTKPTPTTPNLAAIDSAMQALKSRGDAPEAGK
jgi:hypothetical protein